MATTARRGQVGFDPTTTRRQNRLTSAAEIKSRICGLAPASVRPRRSSIRGGDIRIFGDCRGVQAEMRISARSGLAPVKGVADGSRTRDRRDHNAELYQLSYSHLARPNLACGAGGWCRGCPHWALPAGSSLNLTPARSSPALLGSAAGRGGLRPCYRRLRRPSPFAPCAIRSSAQTRALPTTVVRRPSGARQPSPSCVTPPRFSSA